MEGLKESGLTFECTSNVLFFDLSEWPIDQDLHRQFEAASKLPGKERTIARHLLEGLVLKHDAKRFEQRRYSSG